MVLGGFMYSVGSRILVAHLVMVVVTSSLSFWVRTLKSWLKRTGRKRMITWIRSMLRRPCTEGYGQRRPKSIWYPQCLPHLQTQINMIPSILPTFTDTNQYDTLNAAYIYRPKSIRYPQCLPHLQTSFSRTCWAEVSNISLCIYI